MTYTITKSRKQIRIETSHGQRWLYPRSEVGTQRADRKVTALEAVGYTDSATTKERNDDPAGENQQRRSLD